MQEKEAELSAKLSDETTVVRDSKTRKSKDKLVNDQHHKMIEEEKEESQLITNLVKDRLS